MMDCALLTSGLLGADKTFCSEGSGGGEATAAWWATGVTECGLDVDLVRVSLG